jgi:uncharacterized phage protein gp47/JayE
MAFRIKTFDEIVAKMVTWVTGHTTKVTDFNAGSTLRTILEAVAWVIKDIYSDLFITFRTALKNFIYDSFGFAGQEALTAGGNVRFSADVAPVSDINIPIGTTGETGDGIQFVTTAAGVLLAGNLVTADIPVSAVIPGSSGNVGAGTITNIVQTISGLTTCTNPLVTTGGVDSENDSDKQTRFTKYVRNLARSTAYGIEAGAETVSGVKQAQLVESGTKGLLYLYIDDGSGSASAGLLTSVQNIIEGNMTATNPGYRGAGTIIWYYAAITVGVTIVQTVYVKRGADLTSLKTAIETEETRFINSYLMGVNLRLEAIRSDVMKQFIGQVLEVVLSAPVANVNVVPGEVVKVAGITTTLVEVDE